MTMRRCPQCHNICDDQYGFCIKCGCEFPKMDAASNICPLCNYQNPAEADYCVKCGTPLLFKNQGENNANFNPIIINRTNNYDISSPRTSRILIALGYLFSLFGGILGLIIAIYLATRKDPVARKHGKIQLAIFVFYILIIIIFIATGALTMNDFNNYFQMMMGNSTNRTLL